MGPALGRSELSLENLDPHLLMWDMRRNLDPKPMPKRRSTIQFLYPELPATHRAWWLIVTPGEGADLCSVDPGFDVDLYVVERPEDHDGDLDGPRHRARGGARRAA